MNVYLVPRSYCSKFHGNAVIAVMTSFGWKRKIGSSVVKNVSEKFENSAKDQDESLLSDEVDWLTLAPKRLRLQLEDAVVKSGRLRQEGITLAESERYLAVLTDVFFKDSSVCRIATRSQFH